MARTTTQAKPQATSVQTRFSLGSAWTNSKGTSLHAAGALRPAAGDYRNEQGILNLLPEPPEGFQWEMKIFHNRSQSPKAPAYDVCLQLSEMK